MKEQEEDKALKKSILSVVMVGFLTISMVVPVLGSASPTTEAIEADIREAIAADEAGRAARAAAAQATSSTAATQSARAQDAEMREQKMIIPVEEGSTKTTLEESIDLAAGAPVDPVALSGGASIIAEAADPAMISLAKMDIKTNNDVVTALGRMRIGMTYGVANAIGAGKLSASDGRAIKSQTINIDIKNLKSAKGVAILVYRINAKGERVASVVKPNFSKGKLKVKLPVPCEYAVIQNVAYSN